MTHFRIERPITLLLVLVAGLLIGGGALAQANNPAAPPAVESQSFTGSEIEAFPSARTNVQEITSDFQEKARDADAEELASRQQEMSQAQVAAGHRAHATGSGSDVSPSRARSCASAAPRSRDRPSAPRSAG